jgi:CHAD domain-containing protein
MMSDYALQQTAILLRRLAFQANRAARTGDAESVHDLRVAIRRLSRCLRAFSQFYPDNSWKKVRHSLHALMAMAGSVRDRDIAAEVLALAGVPAGAVVYRQLAAERRKAAQELTAELRHWKQRSLSRKWRQKLGV